MVKISEHAIGEAALKVLATCPGGTATIRVLKERIPNHVNFSAEDLRPSPTSQWRGDVGTAGPKLGVAPQDRGQHYSRGAGGLQARAADNHRSGAATRPAQKALSVSGLIARLEPF